MTGSQDKGSVSHFQEEQLPDETRKQVRFELYLVALILYPSYSSISDPLKPKKNYPFFCNVSSSKIESSDLALPPSTQHNPESQMVNEGLGYQMYI